MIVVDIFIVKGRGTAVIFNSDADLSKLKLNHIIYRPLDAQEWSVSGIEKWSGKTIGAILLKGDAQISIGNELELKE